MALNTRTYTIIGAQGIPLVLSVPPLGTTNENSQGIKSADILGFGEIVFSGEKKAQRTNLSSFFPSIESPFYKPLMNPLPPIGNLELLKKWKDDGDVVTLVVPETLTYLECIITSLVEEERDFTNDKYFSISLVEARDFDRETSNVTGLFERF